MSLRTNCETIKWRVLFLDIYLVKASGRQIAEAVYCGIIRQVRSGPLPKYRMRGVLLGVIEVYLKIV